MKSVWVTLAGLTCMGLVLTGCSMFQPQPVKQEGEIELKAVHATIPKDGDIYQVHNLKQAGGSVFLFPNDAALADCYFALEAGQDAQAHCWSAVEAEVEDKEMVRALACHKSKYAICMVQVIEGHAAGVKGAILWDWLQGKP